MVISFIGVLASMMVLLVCGNQPHWGGNVVFCWCVGGGKYDGVSGVW